jgi:hypothetical protein
MSHNDLVTRTRELLGEPTEELLEVHALLAGMANLACLHLHRGDRALAAEKLRLVGHAVSDRARREAWLALATEVEGASAPGV